MGHPWTLWLLVFIFSTPSETQSVTSRRFSSNGEEYYQDTLTSTGVRLVTPSSHLRFTAEGQQREPLPRGSKDDNIILTSENHLPGLAAVYSVAISIPARSMDPKEKSLKTLEMQNSKSDSILLMTAASLNHTLGGVERQEVRDCDLVLAYDVGLQHPQLQHYAPLVEQVNTTEDVLRVVWESSMCRGHLPLPVNLEPLMTCTSNSHRSWEYHGRGRRRRRSASYPAAGGAPYCHNCSFPFSLDVNVDQDVTLVDLVSYVISLTSGRQFYLVYDAVMPGVVRAFQEVLGDTILLPYDPSILLLKEALTSNHHVQAMRNVFILCSATHIANLFEQVRNQALESPTIQWFVIVDKDLTKELPVLLREGTQVVLVQQLTPKKAQLFSSRVDPDGQIRFYQVGSWSATSAWRTNNQQVKDRLAPDFQQLYSDFQGRQLVVTTITHWPFFKIKVLKNGTIIPVSGIDLSLINTLGEKLNFTYQLVSPLTGRWGGPQPDNTITGLVGQVARHEAHAALCSLTITAIREAVVDFTMPYYLETGTMMSPAPKEKNRSFAILSPFTLGVWLCICLVTVLVGPLLYMVARLLVVYLGEEDTSHYSLQSFSFNMYRNLMVQGNLINSHRWSLRFIFFSWYLFSFYLYALYSGTLTAALAITAYEKPLDSIHQLPQAHRDGYTIGTYRDSNYVEAFKTAKSGIYQEIWQLFDHKDPDQSFLSTENAIEKILKQKYVFLGSQLNIKLNAARRGLTKFYFARQTFLSEGFGIACNTGSPYKDVFSRILILLTEAGLVTKWANDEVIKVSQNIPSSDTSGPAAISLQHLQAAFFIILLGFAISTIVLGTEIMASSWWQGNRTACIEEIVVQVEDRPTPSPHTTAALL